MTARMLMDESALAQLCRQHHIKRLSLFGSRAGGVARPDSDIDLLVEFENGQAPGLLGIAQLEIEFSNLLGGKKVDLRTVNDLSRYFRDDIIRYAQVQYAR